MNESFRDQHFSLSLSLFAQVVYFDESTFKSYELIEKLFTFDAYLRMEKEKSMIDLREEILENKECIQNAVNEGQDCQTFLIDDKDKPRDIAQRSEFKYWQVSARAILGC